MSYSKQAVSGFSWQTIMKIFAAFISLAKISVLARLLSPDDFGLFSLTIIALGLSEAAAQTGINITILQSKRSVSYFLDTAWVISIARGFVIAIMMIIIGFGLGNYFDNPQLISLVSLASLIPVIKGLINPYIISMRKNLKFFNDSLYHLSLILVEGILAVTLGLLLKSVSAMIISMIGAAIIEVIISFSFFKIKPQFKYLKSRAQVIFNSAKWLSLSSLMGYLNDNLDDFIIGKLVGTYKLGLYHNAYALSHKLNYDLARSVHHGTLPVYTKIADDSKRLGRAIFKTLGATSLLLLITSTPVLLFPEFFVNLILGSQWLEVVPLIKWLVLAGVTHSLALIGYTLFLSKGAYKILNTHQFINLLLTISLIIILGQNQGLIGAVKGLAFGRLLSLPVIIYGIYKETN
ncbi:MAG: oligosaccharide flippase family protein [Candidatus Pacebacteria bacterium]|jgi:lipopolysaccharide exporter|nr:oligosaccharide flippase family protein [Candidatus Paceibacterota bacterium]MBT4004812.1 oligosaccharide flippase family protein [Candidatus Paceibacterota bacterium]MBT4358481.1 oligosaccharide flippase family protein [Candidatus Paceibacterota bacterium]MBT7309155.1 oligosaccharide flippase family protein [Candidatus Paceibacterota bacterium]